MTDIPIFDETGPIMVQMWDQMFDMIGGSCDHERIAQAEKEQHRPKLRLIQGGKK